MRNHKYTIPLLGIAGLIILCLVLSLNPTSCQKLKVAYLKFKVDKLNTIDELGKAQSIYRRLIELEPDEYSHYWNLGIVSIQLNDKKTAGKVVEQLEGLGQPDLAQELKKFIQQELTSAQ